MDTSVLQQFLDEGMLDIGDDDSRFEALSKASEVLFEKLTSDLEALAQYTLVALDSDIAPDEPTLQQVEEISKLYWKTIRIRSTDRMRQILRAVILNTLNNFTNQQPNHVAIIWLVGGNYLPFLRSHLEVSVANQVISSMGQVTEQIAVANWSKVKGIESPKVDLPELTVTNLGVQPIDQEQLTELLEAASGPNRSNGQGFTKGIKPNSYWPNSGNNWSYEFAPKASASIAAAVDKAHESLNEDLAVLKEQIQVEVNNYLDEIHSQLKTLSNQITQYVTARSHKVDLIWWKETLYSTQLKRSYRSLSTPVAMLALASDLSKQVPSIYPLSVDFFLRETAQELLADSNEQKKVTRSFADLLNQLQSETDRQLIIQLLNGEETKFGRISLISYLRAFIITQTETIENFSHRVGISSDEEVSLPDFAVWCFRAFQAEQLIALKEF